MSAKLILPLAISALVAAAAAAANTPKTSPAIGGSIAVPCEVSTQRTQPSPFRLRNALANAVIGGLSGRPQSAGMGPGLFPLRPAARNSVPSTIASLEMAASPFGATTATSCYPPLSFSTTSVPAATAGASYKAPLAANGGQPPYSWSFGRSSLPPGFSIDSSGNLIGTATTAGNYAFNVVVSDSLKNNVTGALTLLVASNSSPAPPTPTPTPTPNPPSNPPPRPTPPPGPPTGTALTACADLTQTGSYYLANDVSSPGTCFGIDADGITLNLNGHTITYGTGGGTTPTPAIEGHDCWYKTGNFTGGYCGASHGGVEVYGGNIVQSANSAPFSDTFSFGQGTFSTAPYIHDVTATVQNHGARFYYSAYMPPRTRLIHNTVYDNVTSINLPGQNDLSARAHFQGQAIFIDGTENAPVSVGDTIANNTIVGSPQGGIRTVDQNSTITGNDVSMNAFYSNDYCFEVSAAHTTVSNNNCHPKSGRGVNIDAAYVTISNNIINVTELPQNAEYGTNGQLGCEGGGAYGIRFKFMPFNPTFSIGGDVITGNTVTVTAGACQGVGLQFVLLPTYATISVTGNTFTLVNTGHGSNDYAVGVDSSYGNGVTVTGNTFKASTAYVDGEWDGYGNFTIGHNTWLGTPRYTVNAGDGACDPGQAGDSSVCPASVTVTDNLPNTVNCGPYSEAAVTVGGHLTQCRPTQH